MFFIFVFVVLNFVKKRIFCKTAFVIITVFMLEIKNLCAQFEKKPILNGITIKIKKGEIHALLGPNGSGKSTLGRVILGDKKYRVTKGSVKFEKQNFLKLEPAERAKAGFFLSFQSPPQLDGVNANDFLFAAKKASDPEFHSSFRFKKSLSQHFKNLHLSEEFITREVNKGASGGERRKMEIASLLSLDAKLAFLDEIDSGLDVDGIVRVAKAIQEFMKENDKALVLISHTEKLLNLIQPTHFHILCNGEIIQSGGKELMEKVHKCGFCNFLNKKCVQ